MSDSGGTNLRVGFIELLSSDTKLPDQTLDKDWAEGNKSYARSRVQRLLEKVWPIGEQLKNDKAEDLFAWIGKCIAEVIQDGCLAWPGELPEIVPLGVTFSFPMMSVILIVSYGMYTYSSLVNIHYQMQPSCQWVKALP
jgi:hexokinase